MGFCVIFFGQYKHAVFGIKILFYLTSSASYSHFFERGRGLGHGYSLIFLMSESSKHGPSPADGCSICGSRTVLKYIFPPESRSADQEEVIELAGKTIRDIFSTYYMFFKKQQEPRWYYFWSFFRGLEAKAYRISNCDLWHCLREMQRSLSPLFPGVDVSQVLVHQLHL